MNLLDMKTHRTLTFGKYKGRLVHDICYLNPSYLKWLEENTDFKMNDEEREHYKEWINIRGNRGYDVHPGGEARCNPWESWTY